jgi:hypothetical protein
LESDTEARRICSDAIAMKRAIYLSLAWILAGAGLGFSLLMLAFMWNLFNFHPEFDVHSLAAIAGILGTLAGCLALARGTRDRGSSIVSLLVCLLLIGLGLSFLPEEPTSHGFIGRRRPSPFWFRTGLAMTTALPLAFWLRWPLHAWLQARGNPRS